MSDTLIYILVAIGLIGLGVLIYFVKFRKGLTTLEYARQQKQTQTSPMGLKIFGKSLTMAELIALDDGAQNYFDIARQCLGYTKKLRHSDWSIFLVPSTLSPEQQLPSYFYPKPFEGEDGQTLIAGEYLVSDKEHEQCWIAIANPLGNTHFAFDVIYNEFEHGGAFNNNWRDFEIGGSPGHIHPLNSDCRWGSRRAHLMTVKCGTNLER